MRISGDIGLSPLNQNNEEDTVERPDRTVEDDQRLSEKEIKVQH